MAGGGVPLWQSVIAVGGSGLWAVAGGGKWQ